jgi:autotransporter adhesin
MTNILKMTLIAAALSCATGSAWAVQGGTDIPSPSGNVCQQDAQGNVSCGAQSNASGNGTTAIGFGATSSTGGSTAVGMGSTASGGGSTASGGNATASGNFSTATGDGSNASGTGSTAIGASSASAGSNDVAVGSLASTLVSGGGTQTSGNIAIGGPAGSTRTLANGGNSTAIGSGAQSTGNNSVALGAGSTDGGQANVVSIGSSTQTRTITNMTAGVNPTDGANVSQLPGVTSNGVFTFGATPTAPTPTSTVTVTNVAPGAVNATSTDAVNGSQLYIVQQLTNKQGATINQVVNGTLGVCTANADGSMQCRPLENSKPSSASGAGAIAIGAGTQAQGAGAQAYGAGASAGYAGSLAIGQGATITAPTDPTDANVVGAVAIGQGAKANADPATAIGYQSNAAGSNSVALGYQATANGNNSVAIGAGSVANRDNSVSVGNAATGQQRQITNVAPGTLPSDAVNLGQLDSSVSYLKQKINSTGAIAMAAANIALPQGFTRGIGVGLGNQNGQTALAVGFVDQPGPWAQVKLTAGFGGNGITSVGAGLSIGW